MKKTLKRRRKEFKTNYTKRIELLKSNKPRIVFRKTNKYLIAQYVTSKQAQDKIEIGITSKKLSAYGWPKESSGSLKSIPAAYLTGFLFGKTVLEKKKENPIVDLGMARTLHKTKIYGFLKGLIDAGLDIKCDEEFFPSEEKLKGKFNTEEIKEKIQNGK